jgi:hypothetical protein
MSNSPHDWLPLKVKSALEEAESRLRVLPSYELAWELVLTPTERQKLGGDVYKCLQQRPNLIAMYSNIRGVSQYRAIIELADQLKLLGYDRDLLLRAIGESAGESDARANLSAEPTPYWDKSSHTLKFAGEVIREVKRPNTATNIIPILDAFQELGWPPRIDDPLPDGADPVRLAEAVKSLNQGLQRVKFRKDGTGKGVVWGFQ